MFDIYWNLDFMLETELEHINSHSAKGAKSKTNRQIGYKLFDTYGKPTGSGSSFLLILTLSVRSWSSYFNVPF